MTGTASETLSRCRLHLPQLGTPRLAMQRQQNIQIEYSLDNTAMHTNKHLSAHRNGRPIMPQPDDQFGVRIIPHRLATSLKAILQLPVASCSARIMHAHATKCHFHDASGKRTLIGVPAMRGTSIVKYRSAVRRRSMLGQRRHVRVSHRQNHRRRCRNRYRW